MTRPLGAPWMFDAGTREGRRSLLCMARRALREGRDALARGDALDALDAFLHAAKVRASLPRYYALRRSVLEDRRHNVGGVRWTGH